MSYTNGHRSSIEFSTSGVINCCAVVRENKLCLFLSLTVLVRFFVLYTVVQ